LDLVKLLIYKEKSPFLTIFELWLTKVYDLRKKYEQELAEMYLIINGMDDDLRQIMTIKNF
jgi:hypothetical protein